MRSAYCELELTVRRFQIAMDLIAVVNKGEAVADILHDCADRMPFES